MRTVYLGTSEFAAAVLRRLADSGHRPLLVATPPDRPKGRGRHSGPPPAAIAATELQIELLQIENVNEQGALERIRAVRPEAIAVCAFGQLIREPLLSEWPLLNVHPSLLPRWRGAAPIERAIMAGDARTGVSLMRLTAGLDAGPVALREEIAIGSEDDFASLSGKLSALGGELLVEALDRAEAGNLVLTEQPTDGITYAEKVDPAERRLDPARPARELERQVRALAPVIGAYLERDGERLGVNAARATSDDVAPAELAARDGRLLLGTDDGALELLEVTPPGRRAMDVAAYLRGHPMS